MPSPSMRWRMKPSPPKKPDPSLRLKATLNFVPRAAARNASFWARIEPPNFAMSRGTILPGTPELKAATLRPPPLLVKCVRNTDSWETTRPAADLSFLNIPASGSEPSPILVSKSMPSSRNIMAPASATTVSPVSSPISTNCRSSPFTS